MRRIAITNEKGGAGKTSHTVCLAGALAAKGLRVLVVDLDPQASASKWLAEIESETFFSAIRDKTSFLEIIRPTRTPGVDIIPSGEWMSNVDYLMYGPGGVDPSAVFRIRDGLDALPNDWDVLLMDCRPGTSVLSLAPLAAAHEVIAPVELQDMGVDGLATMVKRIAERRDQLMNPSLHLSAICPYRARPKELRYKELHQALQSTFGDILMPAIRSDTRMGSCPSHGLPINAVAPKTNAAKDYDVLATALLAQWKLGEVNVAA